MVASLVRVAGARLQMRMQRVQNPHTGSPVLLWLHPCSVGVGMCAGVGASNSVCAYKCARTCVCVYK